MYLAGYSKRLCTLSMAAGLVLASTIESSLPESVQAACSYFAAKDKDINQPGQKAFITWDAAQKSESFTVQPKFEGNAKDFGMVIPTPARPKLDEMPRDFFKDLAIFTILMPLPVPIYSPFDPVSRRKMSFGNMVPRSAPASLLEKSSVRVVESGVVGSLDYKIIVADDASGLYQWLKQNHYSYAGDEGTLRFYIKKNWFFTVMKIDPQQMKKTADGSYTGEVTPTRFTFNSEQCIYPLKITQLSVKDKTDALFYVQSAQQMDLPGDWSWMHSYRPMYLTYMLGCSANSKQQKELESRTAWLETKRRSQDGFETTKLEWAKRLGAPEISVLEQPLKNFGQMGTGDLPPGAKVVDLNEFLAQMRKDYVTAYGNRQQPDYVKQELSRMEDKYQPGNGLIVKNDEKSVGKSYLGTRYSFYPARQAPLDELKGLSRLKGHLHEGQWLTKFRKTIRKEEMTQDILLSATPKDQEQTYVRIMPTSPP